jgi:heme oxygenase
MLRSRTRASHAGIELVPAMTRLVAPDLTPAEYVAVLQYMHAFLASIEPAMAAGLASFPAAAAMLDGARPRALAADLAWFGAAPIRPPKLPGVATVPAALGALYVVEGSSQGGRVIARHIAQSLGVAAAAGGSFYGGLSAEAARRRWTNLCALLEAPVTQFNAAYDEAVAAAACETFACLAGWLRRIDVSPGQLR